MLYKKKKFFNMPRPFNSFPHLFQLANIIGFRKDYSPHPLVPHFDPTLLDIRFDKSTNAQ
jgi:hypothetical protein